MPRDLPSPSGTSRRSLPPWRQDRTTDFLFFVNFVGFVVPLFCGLCGPRFSMQKTRIVMFVAAAFTAASMAAQVQKPLDIHFIDVEGGQATLVVSPSGESMLVDTGWPGFD